VVRRGSFYRVYKGSRIDTKDYRVFVVVGRQLIMESKFSTVTCAPVYTTCDGLSTQVRVGVEEGLKHDSSIHCDELISIPKSLLTDYMGSLMPDRMHELNEALRISLELD